MHKTSRIKSILIYCNTGDCLAYHNGAQFSTKDADHDGGGGGNCAVIFHSAWWFYGSFYSTLNGRYVQGGNSSYGEGIIWLKFHDIRYSLKFTEMKIARV